MQSDKPKKAAGEKKVAKPKSATKAAKPKSATKAAAPKVKKSPTKKAAAPKVMLQGFVSYKFSCFGGWLVTHEPYCPWFATSGYLCDWLAECNFIKSKT